MTPEESLTRDILTAENYHVLLIIKLALHAIATTEFLAKTRVVNALGITLVEVIVGTFTPTLPSAAPFGHLVDEDC